MVNSRVAVRSAFWSGLETGGLAVLSFVSLIVYTHLLAPADLGVFAVVLALVEILNILVVMPYHDALVQKQSIEESDYNVAFTVSMILSIVLAGVCILLSPWAYVLVKHPEASKVVCWMSLSMPLAAVSATIMARQRREFAFRSLALRSILGRTGGALIGIVMALLGYGLWSLVAQQLVMIGAGSLVLWVMASARPKLGFHYQTFLRLSHFGVSSLSTFIINFAIKRVFIILVGSYLGAQASGYLNIAFRTLDTLWSLSASAVSQVALPVLSRLQGDEEKLKRAYFFAVRVCCALLYPCFLGLGGIAPEAIQMLFGDKWLASAPYLFALSGLALLQVPRMFISPMLVARGRPQDNLPGLLAEVAFLVIMISAFGIRNSVWAVGLWAGCEIILTPIAGYMLWRRSGLTARDQAVGLWAPLGGVLVMLAVLQATRYGMPANLPLQLRAGTLLLAGGVSYIATLILLDRSIVEAIRNMIGGALKKAA